jgi:hypothetical protein
MCRRFLKFIILISFVAAACGQADKVPSNVLSKEKMRDVLLDMNIADAHSYDIRPVEGMPLPDSIRLLKVKEYYRQILDLHKISVKEFMNSYRYYESHPDRLKEVYVMMQEAAGWKRTMLEGEERRQQYAADPSMFFPYPNKAVISKKQDTILPFLKRPQNAKDSTQNAKHPVKIVPH